MVCSEMLRTTENHHSLRFTVRDSGCETLRVIADCRSLAGELPAQLAARITDVCSEVTVDVEERCADPEARG